MSEVDEFAEWARGMSDKAKTQADAAEPTVEAPKLPDSPRPPEVVDAIVDDLPPSMRRWCVIAGPRTAEQAAELQALNVACACSGCVNFRLLPEEWDAWETRHPRTGERQ